MAVCNNEKHINSVRTTEKPSTAKKKKKKKTSVVTTTINPMPTGKRHQ